MASPELRYAVRPVAAAALLVLAVVLAGSAVLKAPDAAAEAGGEVDCSQSVRSGLLEWGVSEFLEGLSVGEDPIEWGNARGVVEADGAVSARFQGTAAHFDDQSGAWLTITDPVVELNAAGDGALAAEIAHGIAEPDEDGAVAFDPDQEPNASMMVEVVTLNGVVGVEPRAFHVDDFEAHWAQDFRAFLDSDPASPLTEHIDDSAAGKPSTGSISGVLSALPTGCSDDDPTETDPPVNRRFEVDNAVFRWGVNNQSNALSHDPPAINFLMADQLDLPADSRATRKKHWKGAQGNVRIEKWNGARWTEADWAGLFTDASGKKKTNTTSIFSGHNVVFRGGTGSVDLVSGDVSIQWKGDFSVIYYSGDIRVMFTDPTLSIIDGVGKVTAVVGGGANGNRPGGSGGETDVEGKRVVIADLAEVDLDEETGFTAEPQYLGERVRQQTAADASGEYAGAFPQELVDVLVGLGADRFWYSTSPTAAVRKSRIPLPITVSYDEAHAKTPKPPPTSEPTDEPTIDNPVNNPPAQTPQTAPAPQAATPAPAAAAPGLPATVPESQRQLLSAADLGAVRPAAATRAQQAEPDHTWWLVGSLLLVAAFVLTIPTRPRA